MKQPT